MPFAALLPFALPATLCEGQTAAAATSAAGTVVFFTPGGFFRGAGDQFKHTLWGKADMASFGSVYDGAERLVTLPRARYLVIRVPPGPHTFSANISHKKPNPKEELTVTIAAGGVTYIAETSTVTNYGLGVVQTMTSHLSESTCREFAEEDAKVKMQPVQPKKIAPASAGKVDEAYDVLNCKP